MRKESGKIAIYTAICGDCDALQKPEVVGDECDHICFTDQQFSDCGAWEVRPLASRRALYSEAECLKRI